MSNLQFNYSPGAALEEQQQLAAQYAAEQLAKTVRISRVRIESAEDLSARSAKMKDIRRFRLLHEDRVKLNAAASAAADELGLAPLLRLAPSRHDVYAMIRTAVVKGYAGLRAAAKEICRKLDMKIRTFWHAMADLRRLKLIGSTENFEASGPYSCVKTKRTYHNFRVENTYWIAHKAPQRDFRMALEAEGRKGKRSTNGESGASFSSPPTDKTTEVCTTPPCENGTTTPRLRRREGELAPLSPFVEQVPLERALPLAGDAGPANRGSFISRMRARVSPGFASEAEKGEGASSGPTHVSPKEFFASIGWDPAT